MSLSLVDSQTISDISRLLYNFLPGKPHPFADQTISFQGVADELGLSSYWSGDSKLPAISKLLQLTLEYKRDQFCNLIVNIVNKSIIYRNSKNEPIMREEIKRLNELILKAKFKIPELWDPVFIDTLPSGEKKENENSKTKSQLNLSKLKIALTEITELPPQKRGYAFENFLNTLFKYFNLDPHSSFKIIGEQIDGSFKFENEIYLVEAKWQNSLTNNSDLLVLYGKIDEKAKWTRGVFISYTGFTDDALVAFSKGKSTNMVGFTGQDLYLILENGINLTDALSKKIRIAAETGEFYVPIFKLFN